MQSRARGGDDLRTATIDALYNDVDYAEPRDDPDFGLRGLDDRACLECEPPADKLTVESMDELAATPSQHAMVVEESRELAAEIAVAIESEGEVADIAAALEIDRDTTPGDCERLAMAASLDDEALRIGVEQSLAVEPSLAASVELSPWSLSVAAPKRTPPLAANTPLWAPIGCKLINKELRHGGQCMIVSLLASSVAKEDFLHRLLDHLEREADAVNTVVEYHEFKEMEILKFPLQSLRHALQRLCRVSDLGAHIAQLREPIGYRTGARLYAPLDRAALLAAASYLQQDIIVLDASTAMPLHAIVCNSRFVPRAPGVFQACAFVNLTKRGVGACDSLSPGRSAYMLSPSRCGWETTCITWRWCT